jgi:hypothetical protein
MCDTSPEWGANILNVFRAVESLWTYEEVTWDLKTFCNTRQPEAAYIPDLPMRQWSECLSACDFTVTVFVDRYKGGNVMSCKEGHPKTGHEGSEWKL